jgi:hypothetical protein
MKAESFRRWQTTRMADSTCSARSGIDGWANWHGKYRMKDLDWFLTSQWCSATVERRRRRDGPAPKKWRLLVLLGEIRTATVSSVRGEGASRWERECEGGSIGFYRAARARANYIQSPGNRKWELWVWRSPRPTWVHPKEEGNTVVLDPCVSET